MKKKKKKKKGPKGETADFLRVATSKPNTGQRLECTNYLLPKGEGAGEGECRRSQSRRRLACANQGSSACKGPDARLGRMGSREPPRYAAFVPALAASSPVRSPLNNLGKFRGGACTR